MKIKDKIITTLTIFILLMLNIIGYTGTFISIFFFVITSLLIAFILLVQGGKW